MRGSGKRKWRKVTKARALLRVLLLLLRPLSRSALQPILLLVRVLSETMPIADRCCSNLARVSGLVSVSATMSFVEMYLSATSFVLTRSRTKSWATSKCLVRPCDAGFDEMAMAAWLSSKMVVGPCGASRPHWRG